MNNNITYTDAHGTFRLKNPVNLHELYFPLCNKEGFMSCITPVLHGDIKIDQHHFALAPVSVEDLHNTKSARNFWVYIHGKGAFSVANNSSAQRSLKFTEKDASTITVDAGPLWHKLTVVDPLAELKFETTNFVPVDGSFVEIMRVVITNIGKETVKFTPTSAIPLYGRSADNIRDHRHVTSLVNRLIQLKNGVAIKPEIVFDERGHKYNDAIYYVIGSENDGDPPTGAIPWLHSFIGDAGTLEWPEAVVRNLKPNQTRKNNGNEYIGALRFKDCTLKPGEKKEYIILTGISFDADSINKTADKFLSKDKCDIALDENKTNWNSAASQVNFDSGLENFSQWMKWVSLQPIFRKIYGCSFLPYHDYGRGGRGWRDLWQDCLSLILQNPSEVRQLLLDNCAGIRLDGTNATIIGSRPGEFLADRNNIVRVWMDHGTWPYLTIKLYIDQSGDFNLLFEKQSYFRDALIYRAKAKDETWKEEKGLKQCSIDGSVYLGSLLEHLMVQHLTSFFNVGEHNIILLEGADWNDTLDMARERGESTAFTALYGSNLIGMSNLILEAGFRLNMDKIEIFEELTILLDTLEGKSQYDNIEYKTSTLNTYLDAVSKGLSGKTASISIKELAADLRKKGEWITQHILKNEFIETKNGYGFYNGYYNNHGHRVDGEFPEGVRMNLTAQVFTTMFGIASDEQVKKIHSSCNKYLKDPFTGGYRLNTPLGPNKLNLGRCFAFAYGEKENGSTFCHMAVMYMNALYRRNFVNEAYAVFKSLFELAQNYNVSGIYPGLPEYFNSSGKGLYHYLTGSASWFLLTVLTQMYGVRGKSGDLIIQPKLVKEQFDKNGFASVKTRFADKYLNVRFINRNRMDYSQYDIKNLKINGLKEIGFILDSSTIKIPGENIKAFADKYLSIDVIVDKKE